MQHADSDFAMNCEISEIAACNVFSLSTWLTGLLFYSEDQFSVFYDVLMCLMYSHNVLFNGQGAHRVNYPIELLNILIGEHVHICNSRTQLWITTINNVPFV